MNLSIIIPTLNEAQYISETVCKVRENAILGEPFEIIVIDSGSCDGTRGIAEELRVRLIDSKTDQLGKSYALNQASSFASGDVMMFLDADSIVPEGYDWLILNSFKNPEVVGGAFEFSLDGREFGLRVVELINRIRYRVRQRYYGDQGIFVRSDAFKSVGGYPEIGLLETAHLCKNLRKEGKLQLIEAYMKTSPRRFLEGGIYRVLLNDIKIWFMDLIGINVNKYASAYWKENKLRSKN